MTNNKTTMPRILLVGGRFAETAGRPSGYIHKLVEALRQELPEGWALQAINGGSYETLCTLVDTVDTVSHLCWFADVPNHLPKLVPQLRDKNPGLLLTLSKNNRIGKYSPADLHERMLTARAEWLVEFTESDNLILASLMTGAGGYALEGEAAIAALAQSMVADYLRLQQLRAPLDRVLLPTSDSESFQKHDGAHETGLPILGHPGAFGVVRRNHVHEGVDLYAQDGTPVYAMEDGVVVYRGWFTGVPAGSPWWHNTECVLIQGASGGLNYGELRVAPRLGPGVSVKKGQCLGHVSRVLREDKGRPRAMLHLERYTSTCQVPIKEWALNTARPAELCDPTSLLLAAQGTHNV
jgi:hypothetical protein